MQDHDNSLMQTEMGLVVDRQQDIYEVFALLLLRRRCHEGVSFISGHKKSGRG